VKHHEVSEAVGQTIERTREGVQTAWRSQPTRDERMDMLRRRRLQREAKEGSALVSRLTKDIGWLADQERVAPLQEQEGLAVNTSHEQLIEQALKGRTTFNYRGWLVNVYPMTVERPSGQRAAAEAHPFDKSKIPPGKSKIASGAVDSARQVPGQLRHGIGVVLATIDRLEGAGG
jgi:hypothetical protein